MGTRARQKPECLPAKLLQIRLRLGLSQSELAERLGFAVSASRVCEFETGAREPNLMVLLAYSQLASIQLEKIVNDRLSLTDTLPPSRPTA